MNKGFLLYLAAALVAFFAATTGSDVFAHVRLGHQTIGKAASDDLYWAGVQWIGTIMLFLPFAFLAAIASWVERKTSRPTGATIFGISASLLICIYFDAYRAAEIAELAHHWTAAALSIGFLPFTAVGIVLLTCVVAFLLVARANQRLVR